MIAIIGRDELRAVVTLSAVLTHDLEVTDAQQVVYNIVFFNSGNGYSNKTGIFTCPRVNICLFASFLLSFYNLVKDTQRRTRTSIP